MKRIKFKKSAEEDVKAELKKIYPLLKEAYREQAGYSPIGNLFAIGENQILLFMKEVIDAIDESNSSKMKTSDLGRTRIAINAGRKGPFEPANALVRC